VDVIQLPRLKEKEEGRPRIESLKKTAKTLLGPPPSKIYPQKYRDIRSKWREQNQRGKG